MRFTSHMYAAFYSWQISYYRFKQGLMDAELWDERERAMLHYIVRPGVQHWWRGHGRHLYIHSFITYVDGKLAAHEAGELEASPVDAYWDDELGGKA